MGEKYAQSGGALSNSQFKTVSEIEEAEEESNNETKPKHTLPGKYQQHIFDFSVEGKFLIF